MDLIKDGWFHEINKFWPGQCMCLKVEKVIFQGKSKYQDVLVFQSANHGKVLVLDGVIQCTERDEFSYQEMITHLPLCSHDNPENVLVIGGGDGGVVREVLKHDCVKSVTQCEIDEAKNVCYNQIVIGSNEPLMVINICKEHFPSMASSYDNPRLQQHVGDGFQFMREHPNSYDVIITDSSDPEGPAESLFEKPYFELMQKALKPNGIICTQGECIWLHMDLIKTVQTFCKKLFPSVSYAYCTIPTYPSGQIGFMLCSLNKDQVFEKPVRKLPKDQIKKMNLKYYNPGIHAASFVLPEFARIILNSSNL